MEKICKRRKDWIQVFNSDGTVRLCSWTGRHGHTGSLLEHSLPEIFHGEKAEKLREHLLAQDYSCCSVDDCHHLMTGGIETIKHIRTYGDFILYGKGNITAVLIRKLKENGILPLYVIDSYKKGGDKYRRNPSFQFKRNRNIKR